ncbi:Uncharacterized protein FKW44_015801 [Caligus rogercresseyi]|uniref:C2H2-type domain-containing protein n=1 Tax=Caligus rogercresseyi TaxID=217165 RepID=A0A7T8H0U4_CALRO|nr:Uncharacterized protein FKW44_015801 [Caligus rogercresseyi]
MPLAAKASLDAAVHPSGIGGNRLDTRDHTTVPPCHGPCTICADAHTFSPNKSIRCHKRVQHMENVFPCCSCFEWFAEQHILID